MIVSFRFTVADESRLLVALQFSVFFAERFSCEKHTLLLRLNFNNYCLNVGRFTRLFMAPSILSPLIPPGHLSGICRAFVVFLNNVANAPQWGQLIRANPHGGASGRVQTPDPNRIKSPNRRSEVKFN